MSDPTFSFVIPVLNESDTLRELYRRLVAVVNQLPGTSEIVFVDDGSTDASFEIMRDIHRSDQRVRVVRLSRRFGHQMALTAGLDRAAGEAVIIMDGDLQDPPEVALELAKKWQEGYEVVYAVRSHRSGESVFKRKTASLFYRLMGHMGEIDIPPETGDFRLVDRRAVDDVSAMREHRRYLRGMFAWIGYSQTGVSYERDARYAGRTKFSMRRMIAFAVDGIVSFSEVPLRFVLAAGFLVSAFSLLLGAAAVVVKISNLYTVPGWASLSVGIAFFSGVQLSVLGVMGLYVARIHEEVKHRPLYLVRDTVGFERSRGNAELRSSNGELWWERDRAADLSQGSMSWRGTTTRRL